MRLMSKARPSQKTRAGRHGFKKSPETAASGLILRLDIEFWLTGACTVSVQLSYTDQRITRSHAGGGS